MATVVVERHTHSCQFSSDGSSWSDFSDVVLSVTTSHSVHADRGTVEIHCYAYPSGLAMNDFVIVYLDGVTRFSGRLARPARNHVAGDIVFYCEGRGAYLAKGWKADLIGDPTYDDVLDDGYNRVYENQEDGAIITNLAEAARVEVSMHEIESSGAVRGTIFPVVLRPGQTFWSLIRGEQGLDEPVGYITFEDNRGVIVRMPFNVDPGSVAFTATEGVDIISATRTPQGTESIINRCIYYGPEYEGGVIGGIGIGDYSLPNSNIDGYNVKVIRTNIVEDDSGGTGGECLAAATVYVEHHNFPYDEASLTLLGDPSYALGQTGNIDSVDGLDYAGDSSSIRFVAGVSERYGAGVGYESQLTLIRPVESW